MIGQVAGGMLSLFGQKIANEWAFDRNSQLAALQNRYNLDAMNMVNSYNDPKNQLARMKRAGVNPDIAWSNGGLVNLSSPAPAMSAGSPMQPLDITGTAGGMIDALSSGKLADANTESIKADTVLKKAQAKGQEITNENLQQKYNAELDILSANYKQMQNQLWEFEQNKDAILEESVVRAIDARVQKAIKSGIYQTEDGFVTFGELMQQLTGIRMTDEIAQRQLSKKKAVGLMKDIQSLINGEVDAAKTLSKQLERLDFELEQDKAIPDLIEELSGMGEYSRFIAKFIDLLLRYKSISSKK